MSNNIWQEKSETYHPANIAAMTKVIPPGIYQYMETMQGWFLEKTSSRYTFPYKIYGAHNDIIYRVATAWGGLESNVGVLLNGIKGTGKTITAQMIVNWAIDHGIMVLNVPSPVPLATIMSHVEQPMLVLFDEFEKTHAKEVHPMAQQNLLSAIDGLSRNEYRRMFLFTTNNRVVNENLVDRPSRIRYCWEFSRISDELIEMILNDLLDPELAELRPEILRYFSSREVLTIDVIKTVIIECNLFREGPEAFKSFMNLSEKEPGGFRLEIVDGDTVSVASDYFRVSSISGVTGNPSSYLSGLLTKYGRESFVQTVCSANTTRAVYGHNGQRIELISPTEKPDEWICYIMVPTYTTWVGNKLTNVLNSWLWLDQKPAGWKMPEWARKEMKSEDLTDEEENEKGTHVANYSVFGTSTKQAVVIRITPDITPFAHSPSRYQHLLRRGDSDLDD